MEEKIKQLLQQYNKGGFTQSELEWELLNLYAVSGRSELLKAFADWRDENEDWINTNCINNDDVVKAFNSH